MTYNFNLVLRLNTGETLFTKEGFTIENTILSLSNDMISKYITHEMKILFAEKYVLPPVDGATVDDGYLVLDTLIVRVRDIKTMHFDWTEEDEETLDKEIL